MPLCCLDQNSRWCPPPTSTERVRHRQTVLGSSFTGANTFRSSLSPIEGHPSAASVGITPRLISVPVTIRICEDVKSAPFLEVLQRLGVPLEHFIHRQVAHALRYWCCFSKAYPVFVPLQKTSGPCKA